MICVKKDILSESRFSKNRDELISFSRVAADFSDFYTPGVSCPAEVLTKGDSLLRFFRLVTA